MIRIGFLFVAHDDIFFLPHSALSLSKNPIYLRRRRLAFKAIESNVLLHATFEIRLHTCIWVQAASLRMLRPFRPSYTYPVTGQAYLHQGYDLLSRSAEWCTTFNRSFPGQKGARYRYVRASPQLRDQWCEACSLSLRYRSRARKPNGDSKRNFGSVPFYLPHSPSTLQHSLLLSLYRSST